jgi:hypothetical protein
MKIHANVVNRIRALLLLALIPASICSSLQMHSLTMVLNICNVSSVVSPLNLTSILNKNAYHDNLPDMMDACSHGYRTYSTTVLPYTIYIPCKNSVRESVKCNSWDWSSQALNILKERSPTIYNQHYDHVIFILPDFDSCDFAGLAVIGPCSGRDCRIWITSAYATQLATYMHEIGHTLGLLHAGFNESEYGDYSSAMGECCYQRCYNAANTQFLNWTHPKYSFNILPFRAFSKDILLQPNEYIIVDTPYDARYFIQYRYPISVRYDDVFIGNFSKCINVYHTEFEHPSKTDLLNLLCSPTSSWSNSKEHFTITVKTRVNSSTMVNIKSIQTNDTTSQTCASLY